MQVHARSTPLCLHTRVCISVNGLRLFLLCIVGFTQRRQISRDYGGLKELFFFRFGIHYKYLELYFQYAAGALPLEPQFLLVKHATIRSAAILGLLLFTRPRSRLR